MKGAPGTLHSLQACVLSLSRSAVLRRQNVAIACPRVREPSIYTTFEETVVKSEGYKDAATFGCFSAAQARATTSGGRGLAAELLTEQQAFLSPGSKRMAKLWGFVADLKQRGAGGSSVPHKSTPFPKFLSLTSNDQGKARTQSPTTTNYAVEFPAFGEIAGVSTPGVQWMSLALGEPPS